MIMPNYRGHLVGGFAAFVCVAYWVPVQATLSTLLEWLMFTFAGALFPDVDIKSKGQKLFYSFLFMGFVYLIINNHLHEVAFLSVVAFVPLLVKHRGLFHQLWFVILFPALIGMSVAGYFPRYAHIVYYDTLFFIIGSVSHLLLDLGLRKTFRFR
jgi:membrane-bound metal-dependent hydrolase YbcI (DUF457 family)